MTSTGPSFLCLLFLPGWLMFTSTSCLYIDLYVFVDWSTETDTIQNLMNREIASLPVDVTTSFRLLRNNVTIDNNVFYQTEKNRNDANWTIALDIKNRVDMTACLAMISSGVPYITTSLVTSATCAPITLHPSIEDFVNAAIDVFQIAGVESAESLILLDKDYDINFSTFATMNSGRVIVYNINELLLEEKARRLLINVRRVVVLASNTTILQLFEEVEEVAQMSNNDWILIPVDSSICPDYLNVSYICIHGQTEKTSHEYVIEVMNFIEDAVTLNHTSNSTSMEHFLWSLPTYEENLSLISITKHVVSVNEPTLIGNWEKSGKIHLNITPGDIFDPPPPPIFKVVIIHEPPFIQRVMNENRSVTYEGYTIDVLNELARRTGFTYEVYEVPDNQYGVSLPDGTWTGVIGEVASGVADMGAGPISVTAERESVIDFTAPYYDFAGLQILMKDPRETQSLFVFASVFSELAWGIWFSILLATVIVVYIFHKFKYKDPHQMEGSSSEKDEWQKEGFSLKNSVWFVTMSVALAGPEDHPTTFSSRVAVAGFWFFCQVIMSAYTANLAAVLTSSRMTAPVESLDDLVTQSTYRYTVQKGTVGETYFQRMAKIEKGFSSYWEEVSFNSDEGSELTQYAVWDYPLGDTYIKLWESIQKTGFVINSDEGIEKVMKENYVLFHETPMIKFEMSKKCGLLTVGTMFSAKPYAFVLPQNSPLLENISNTVLALQTDTLLTTLKEKWWENTNVTCAEDDESDGLNLNALGGIFIVIAGGCILSVIILGVELLTAKFTKDSTTSTCNGEIDEDHAVSYETNIPADTCSVTLQKIESSSHLL